MKLAVNIGNTNIRVAVEDKPGTFSEAIFKAQEVPGVKDFIELTQLRFGSSLWNELENSIVSSVVPKQAAIVVEAIERKTGKKPQRIDVRNCGELDTSCYGGTTIGEDRVVCSFGALQKYTPPFIMIDFGTATTANVISGEKKFLGGAIFTGLQIGLKALSNYTAQLPHIDVGMNVPVIGTNTEENILSGAVIGSACAMDGYIRRIEGVLGRRLPVIVTGGNAPVILPYCDFKYSYEPNLLFDGLFALI